ncbi:UDP-2,3-diacylglucosamine diphosphatase LpxI [Aminobacter anthyllidis]|uniref:UDP-2,3-diacylglucosamine diphosphatase LpxI n=1 Tax=Aminobacter anthyllidis TaxID=1035067 RepID=A0A9X1A7W5_9HYPH|nr:UDP-2,3-diacylglucosamine diphosphatase LpxI [Aminobacter anthyllidis]MBT1154842.1 UDP-2,3-diacylglucosamine diphosphatase LpxI [Aminobacter anthyllidis]
MTKAEGGKRIDLSATDRVAVVAGSGRLPVNVADSLAEAGHKPFIVLIEGETDPGTSLWNYSGERLAIEQFASLVPLLKRHNITHCVLAGGISRRPAWRAIRPSVALLRVLPRALAALARGDDGLLRILVETIEDNGIKVVGAHQVVPELLAVVGRMGALAPQEGDWADLRAGQEAARTIGALDVGQAAVAIGGRAIALEGIEGTDLLLERVRDLRNNGRIVGRKRGVLVKCAKPNQELRADLPTIGPATIDAAHAAGLAGIGIEAGRSLVLDYGEVVERADRLGLFVIGLSGEGSKE